MSLKGSGLEADLTQLLMIGRVDLPLLAHVYTEMKDMVAGSNEDGPAFSIPGGGGIDGVGGAWCGLRDWLDTIFGNTSQALSEAASTIVYIAHTYADTDGDIKASLDSVWGENLDIVPKQGLLPPEILLPDPSNPH